MLEDDVLRQVRAAREAYAKSHGYNVRAMVADLRTRNLAGDWLVVRHPPRRPKPVAVIPNQAQQPIVQASAGAENLLSLSQQPVPT